QAMLAKDVGAEGRCRSEVSILPARLGNVGRPQYRLLEDRVTGGGGRRQISQEGLKAAAGRSLDDGPVKGPERSGLRFPHGNEELANLETLKFIIEPLIGAGRLQDPRVGELRHGRGDFLAEDAPAEI